LRLNEARHLTYNDIQKGISSSQLSVIHHKTKSPHIHILSKKALKDLKSLNTEYQVVFEQHQFKYLFGKLKPIAQKSLIRLVNRDLKYTREIANIPFNIKSHSFRINLISSLLKITSVQHVADIIGHDDIRSTLKYQRYALEKEEVQNLLDKINNLKN
jgi:integrase